MFQGNHHHLIVSPASIHRAARQSFRTTLPFLGLQRHAAVVVTDSGGIQEETTYLGVPCLTMRANTERPITVTIGTNQLLGNDTERMVDEVLAVLGGHGKQGKVPELWDGRAAERLASVCCEHYLEPECAR
jgi:UDP-N-acetylglucosamine 2-epimerase (non-hydrolysing)